MHSSASSMHPSTAPTTPHPAPALERGVFHKGRKDCARAPCPALNTLANHGYISRDGRNITRAQLTLMLREIYGLRREWAFYLTLIAMIGIGKKKLTWRGLELTLDLDMVSHFGHVAPLFHRNPKLVGGSTPGGVVRHLVELVLVHASDRDRVTLRDFATSRVVRESKLEQPIDAFSKHTAQGELALMLLVFGDSDLSVSKSRVESFVLHERLPSCYTLPKTGRIGVEDVILTGIKINQTMRDIEKTGPVSTCTFTTLFVLLFALAGLTWALSLRLHI